VRICTLALEGYGLFSDRVLELDEGLQVIIGPNEQGKTTLRNFIGDMFYGQKRGPMHRLYDPEHELRRPWADPDRYGGRVVYQLDDGRRIEVTRSFSEKNESVRVYDQTNARDITDDFERLGSREPAFALSHLGLTKDVFLGTATFSQITIDRLGDKNALAEIRKKLLSLADSGEEISSAETALNWLANRIVFIGQQNAAHRPLPAARARHVKLSEEHDAALALRDELAGIGEKRRALLDEERVSRRRRVKLQEELTTLERAARAERLAEAERLTEQIEAATERCFTLSSVREFPLDRLPEVQRTEAAIDAAQAQLEHMRAERKDLERQLEAERKRLGPEGAKPPEDIPEEVEIQLADLESQIVRLRDRLDEAQSARESTEERRQQAEDDLATLPDFSRMASDPVEWLTQLSSSFRVAQRSRDDECAKREKLDADIEQHRETLAGPQGVFAQCDDFPAMARDYEFGTRLLDEQLGQRMSYAESLEADTEEYADRQPGFMHMSIVSAVLLITLLGVAYATGNWAILITITLTGLGLLWFLCNWAYVRVRAKGAARELEAVQDEIAGLQGGDANRETIEQMMRQADSETIRELEALFDQYRETTLELTALEQAAEEQQARAREAEERVAQLLERYRRTFAELDVLLEDEEDIDDATSQALARYQEYRDAKRRMMESKELLQRRQREISKLSEGLETLLETERDLSLEVRQKMRDSGYIEESKHDSALRAVRSYRIRAAQLHERCGRMDVLQENATALDQRIGQEEQELKKHEEVLAQSLKDADVESTEAWHTQADRAREYQDTWDNRIALEKQLEALLRGQQLAALRAQVEADGPCRKATGGDIEAIKRKLATLGEKIDALQEQEHALHITLAERAASARSLNEIEEERAAVERRIEELDFERRAVGYAMAQIEEVARDKHSRIAPRLAAAASAFLSEITAGAYEELLIDRDLRISVRIPQTKRIGKDIEQRLSKGTVDQIYLALRLAMVRILSENRESIPMLLDDPFANYDDERLERTMRLLARITENHQILLFTCHEDVVRTAKLIDAPILEL